MNIKEIKQKWATKIEENINHQKKKAQEIFDDIIKGKFNKKISELNPSHYGEQYVTIYDSNWHINSKDYYDSREILCNELSELIKNYNKKISNYKSQKDNVFYHNDIKYRLVKYNLIRNDNDNCNTRRYSKCDIDAYIDFKQ